MCQSSCNPWHRQRIRKLKHYNRAEYYSKVFIIGTGPVKLTIYGNNFSSFMNYFINKICEKRLTVRWATKWLVQMSEYNSLIILFCKSDRERIRTIRSVYILAGIQLFPNTYLCLDFQQCFASWPQASPLSPRSLADFVIQEGKEGWKTDPLVPILWGGLSCDGSPSAPHSGWLEEA